MASEAEIKLGRLVVERKLATEEQVLRTLRERNEDPDGPDLGARLVKRGLIDSGTLPALVRAVEAGESPQSKRRHDMSTDHMIPLAGAREAIARECLREALEALSKNRDSALQEMRRLSREFPDTESGNKAQALLKELEGSAG